MRSINVMNKNYNGIGIYFGKYWKGIRFNLPNCTIRIAYYFSDIIIDCSTPRGSYELRIIGFPKFKKTKIQSIDPCLSEQEESEQEK